MGFLDKAKDLAAKADSAIANSGLGGPGSGAKEADKLYRDLGLLAYLEATGRPVEEADRTRLLDGLRSMESQGQLPSFALTTAVPPPPPPPGAAVPPPPPPPPPPSGG